LVVDQQGNVFIPTAGQFFVSGISYESLQKKLTSYLSQFYEGLAGDPPTIFLDISLSKLKPIKIFVTGEVAQPGGYNISSFATVFNALYSVGGPLTSGSLREIRVIRNNKVLTSVDIYDYILKGQLIGDVRLQNNDMIFIPPRKKSISISGEVFRPAIYELKDGENLQKLIDFAGGLNATAYTGRLQINRIIPFEKRVKNSLDREYIDADLGSVLSKSSDIQLYDKDILTVFPILNKLENFVKIDGSVYRPGTYEYSTVKKLSELIKRAEGVLPETYYGKADIIRTRSDESREFI
jgi:polysaccharide export outer membrane protein